MGLFLKILGALFLGLILVAVFGVLYLRYRIRKAFRGLGDALQSMTAAAQPATVHLDRAGSIDWQFDDGIREAAEPMQRLGFHDAGQYTIDEIPGVNLWAFVNPTEAVYAVVYEHPMAGVAVDFVTQYEDGTGITYTTASHGAELDHRPGHDKVYLVEASTEDLYRKFLAGRPQGVRKAVSAQAFAAVFEEAYADDMAWRNARGGPTERELRAIAARSGIAMDEEEFAAAREMFTRQAIEGLEEPLRERFLEVTAIPAREWEELRDRLVFIHDRLSAEMLGEIAENWIGVLDEEDEDEASEGWKVEIEEGETARDAFARFNAGLEDGRRFVKVGEVDEPLEADAYRAPGGVDDADED